METNINYSIPESLHKEAKAAAAKSGVFLKEFIIKAIQNEVKRCKDSQGQ